MPKGEHNRKLSPETWQQVIGDYLTPLPDGTWRGCDSLASKYGVSQSPVYYHLRAAGVPTRSSKEAHAHGKRCKPITSGPPADMPTPLCKCGCGQPVDWNKRKNGWNLYVGGHYRPKRPYHSREWLEREYVQKHRTIPDIASEFGVTHGTVTKAIDHAGIPCRSQGESLRLSGAVAGENNPAWNGGTTPERQRVWKTGEWKELMQQVYKRDHYTCQRCKKPKQKYRRLEAHHVKPWAGHPDLRLELRNLVTLCHRCRRWIHSNANTNRLFID